MAKIKRLFLIDGSHLAYRSYFAFIRSPLITSRGENTSAVYGFTVTLLKILDEERPDYMGVVFDTPEPTFRHETFPDYKATREKMPDEMVPQLGRIREVIDALRIPVVEVPGFEADDVMGSLADAAAKEGIDTFLVTADKDFMQLVGPRVKIYNLGRGGQGVEVLDEEGVEEKFGVRPGKVTEVLGLMGDASDNVPGVAGVGPKTARKLIREYGSIEGVYENLDRIKGTLKTKLEEGKEIALLSRDLVTITRDLSPGVSLEALKAGAKDQSRLTALFKELEFRRLLENVFTDAKKDEHRYELVDAPTKFNSLLRALKKAGGFVVDLETTSEWPMEAEILGLSFAWKEREAFYVPLRAPEGALRDAEGDLFHGKSGGAEAILEQLRPVLEDGSIPKCGQNIKYDMLVLSNHGIELRGVDFDTMVADYMLRPSIRQHNLDSLSLEYLNFRKVSTKDLLGKGKTKRTMAEVPLEEIAPYSCEDADITLRLRRMLEPRLARSKTERLFREVEIPLIRVLMDMEKTGVKIDVGFLKGLSKKLDEKLSERVEEIHRLAGEEFNINSTKQLAHILFEKLEVHKELGVRPRKTKTGYSTDVGVLERLGAHPIARALLDYRQLAKLKNTYVDALPRLVNGRTGRVHTSFNQTVTATGRLSSSDPNLQNVPIRTELGREIRKAFVPGSPGRVILSADYSQIELRIMAHLSEDPALVEAFERGQDVHRATAARIFGVREEDVTLEMRSKAKTINFGVMYGMGPQLFSRETGFTFPEAGAFIENYFRLYPGVRRYLDHTVEEARKKGYVTTLLGRRRYLPELTSENGRLRGAAENMAVNTPLQGTAADLIKVAMIDIFREFEKRKLRSKMIIQVHDELVFEVEKKEIEELSEIVKEKMEGAIKLDVPVVVALYHGPTWYDAH